MGEHGPPFLERFLFNLDGDWIAPGPDRTDQVGDLRSLLATDFLKQCQALSASHKKYAFDGFAFFDAFIELVDESEVDSFLKITWFMFSDYRSKTDWHPWYGQFDPLSGEPRDARRCQLFRRGFVCHELENDLSNLHHLPAWDHFNQLLKELRDFAGQDFVLDGLRAFLSLTRSAYALEQFGEDYPEICENLQEISIATSPDVMEQLYERLSDALS